MHKKMIALDLDGTLLNSESKLSDFTIETIKKISALGHNRPPLPYGTYLLQTTRARYSNDQF